MAARKQREGVTGRDQGEIQPRIRLHDPLPPLAPASYLLPSPSHIVKRSRQNQIMSGDTLADKQRCALLLCFSVSQLDYRDEASITRWEGNSLPGMDLRECDSVRGANGRSDFPLDRGDREAKR
jgi:hypothetical protein